MRKNKKKEHRASRKRKATGYFEKRIYSGKYLEVIRYVLSDYERYKRSFNRCNSKESRDAQKKFNRNEAIRKLTRLMNCNFTNKDIHFTITFSEKLDEKTARKELKNFLERVKYHFKKHDLGEFKYIYAIGEHKKEGIHFHICMTGLSLDKLLSIWRKSKYAGHTTLSHLYFDDVNGLGGLATYFINQELFKNKLGDEDVADHKKRMIRKWTSSKNLVKPKVIKKRIKTLSIKEQPKEIKRYKIMNFENEYNEFMGRRQYVQLKLLE